MNKDRIYEAIVEIKGMLMEHSEELRFTGIAPEELGGWVEWQLRSLKGSSIYLKVALLTVLSSGEFVGVFGGWQFMMPATRCCLGSISSTKLSGGCGRPGWQTKKTVNMRTSELSEVLP